MVPCGGCAYAFACMCVWVHACLKFSSATNGVLSISIKIDRKDGCHPADCTVKKKINDRSGRG